MAWLSSHKSLILLSLIHMGIGTRCRLCCRRAPLLPVIRSLMRRSLRPDQGGLDDSNMPDKPPWGQPPEAATACSLGSERRRRGDPGVAFGPRSQPLEGAADSTPLCRPSGAGASKMGPRQPGADAPGYRLTPPPEAQALSALSRAMPMTFPPLIAPRLERLHFA